MVEGNRLFQKATKGNHMKYLVCWYRHHDGANGISQVDADDVNGARLGFHFKHGADFDVNFVIEVVNDYHIIDSGEPIVAKIEYDHR